MMTEKEFAESQKECASMLGMTLSEYQNYCKNLKVPNSTKGKQEGNTKSVLKDLGISCDLLKLRKE